MGLWLLALFNMGREEKKQRESAIALLGSQSAFLSCLRSLPSPHWAGWSFDSPSTPRKVVVMEEGRTRPIATTATTPGGSQRVPVSLGADPLLSASASRLACSILLSPANYCVILTSKGYLIQLRRHSYPSPMLWQARNLAHPAYLQYQALPCSHRIQHPRRIRQNSL
mgnify:CR=1 FL=1